MCVRSEWFGGRLEVVRREADDRSGVKDIENVMDDRRRA